MRNLVLTIDTVLGLIERGVTTAERVAALFNTVVVDRGHTPIPPDRVASVIQEALAQARDGASGRIETRHKADGTGVP